MPRRARSARRLLVGGVAYLWSVRHAHDPGRCAETLTFRRDGARGSLRLTFASGPGRCVPDGFVPSGTVATDEADLDLHTPGTARALLDAALARGWNPAEPTRRERDGWTLSDAARAAGRDRFVTVVPMSSPSLESRHVSARIHRPAPMVYAYASDPANLPAWAHGLSGSIAREGDVWVAESPMGRVTIAFTPANDLGVLDHDVTLPTGETFHNPFRVLPDGPTTSEVVFTVRRPPGTSREDFARDVAAVAADLNRLKELLE